MCSLQENYDVIRNWERFETGPLTVLSIERITEALIRLRQMRMLLGFFCVLSGRNFSKLASLCSRADWFESYLVGDPKDGFSHDKALIYPEYFDSS